MCAYVDSYNEINHNVLGDMYAFEHYEGAIMSMIYIGLVSDCQETDFWLMDGSTLLLYFNSQVPACFLFGSLGLERVDVYVDEAPQPPQGQVKKEDAHSLLGT